MRLADLFTDLDRCTETVPIDLLTDQLGGCNTCLEDLRPHVRFNDHAYSRNLVHLGPGYAALLLCWRPGQISPIHDHRGAACALRIMSGTATERRFEQREDGTLEETGQAIYRAGQVCGTYDADIHAIRNEAEDGSDLITLHIYTPPMLQFHVYCSETGKMTPCADREVLEEMQRRGMPTDGAPDQFCG